MFTRKIAKDTATQVNSDKIGVQIKLAPVPEPPVEAITVDYTLTLCSVINGIETGEISYDYLLEFQNCIYTCTGNTYDDKYECILVDELEGYSAEYDRIFINDSVTDTDDYGIPLLRTGSPVYILDDGNFTEVGSVQMNIYAFGIINLISLLRQITENRFDGPDGGLYDVIMSNRYGIRYFVNHNSTDVVLVEAGTGEIIHQTFEGVKFNKDGSSNGKTKWTYTWEDEDYSNSPIWPNVNVNFDVYTDSDKPEAGDAVYVGNSVDPYYEFTVKDVFPQKFGARPTMDYFGANSDYLQYEVKKDNDYDKYSLAQIEWEYEDNGQQVQDYMEIVIQSTGSSETYDGVTYDIWTYLDSERSEGPEWLYGRYLVDSGNLYKIEVSYDEQNPGQEVYTAVYVGVIEKTFSIEGSFRESYDDPAVFCEVENASNRYNLISWGVNGSSYVVDETDFSDSSEIGIVALSQNVTNYTDFVLAQNQSWPGKVEWWPVGITTVSDLENSQYAPVWTPSLDIWAGRDYISDDNPDNPEWLSGTMTLQHKDYLNMYGEVELIKWSYPDAPSPYIPPEPETYNCTVSYSVTGEGFTDHPTALTDENNVIVNIPKYVYLKFSQDVEITEE